MTIIGVDPGTTQSAYVTFSTIAPEMVVDAGTYPNDEMLARMRQLRSGTVVFEQIESMGMAVGKETFETVFWTGRFYEAATQARVDRITRRAVKLHLCGSMQAKDTNVRQALIDRFGGSAAKGTKRAQGPLYQVSGHAWSALAVAVTWWDQHRGDGDGGVGVSQRSAAHATGPVPGAQ